VSGLFAKIRKWLGSVRSRNRSHAPDESQVSSLVLHFGTGPKARNLLARVVETPLRMSRAGVPPFGRA